MSKQTINEQELYAKIAKLQEHMDQSVEEGWWGDNMPELLGGDPAKAPMKVPVTPKNYARVQNMLPAMYTAAKVDPNADEIVKQRFGVYLPPYEKWDGTVPSGRGDFLTRNVFGRDSAAAAEAEGTKAQQAEVERQQRVEANAKKLTDLYGKLKELLPAAFEEKAAEPAAAVATPVKESLAESMKRLSLMITEAEVQPKKVTLPADGSAPKTQQYTTPDGATFTGNAPDGSAAPSAGHPAEAVIKEIEDTIAAIEADDPDEEDLQMIAAVKEKVAQCQNIIKQEAEAAKKEPAKDDADSADTAQDEINAQIEKDKQNPQNTPTGSFDSFGTPAAQGSPAATSADPTGQVEKDRIANRMDAEAGANPVGQPADAKKFVPLPWKEIYDLNKSIIGNNPNLIKPGQKFELPNGMGSYTVVPGDTLSGIAAGQGKGKYETNVPPAQPALPKKPAAPQFTPKAPTAPFKKELPDTISKPTGEYYKVGTPDADFQKSTSGNHIEVSDPKVKAMQAKADKDPNGINYRTTVREDQTLARIVSLVNYGK